MTPREPFRPPTREQAGLPKECVIVQTLYNHAARQTLVEVRLLKGPPVHKLYWRRSGETSYTPLGTLDADISIEHPVVSQRPVLFACITRLRRIGENFSGQSGGIAKVDLTHTPSLSAIDLGALIPPNAFVAKLLRANDDGTSLDAIIAYREGGPVRYVICLMEIDVAKVTELETLPSITF